MRVEEGQLDPSLRVLLERGEQQEGERRAFSLRTGSGADTAEPPDRTLVPNGGQRKLN